jgi:hypothetical protein
MVLGGVALLATACGGSKKPAAAPPPVPLTSHYLCSRLDVARLRTMTGDPWHRVVAGKRPDVACDVSISDTQPAEVHVMVDDERGRGTDEAAARLLATLWFRHQSGFAGFRRLPDGAEFNRSDGVLVVKQGPVVYSVQVLSPHHPGSAALPVARQVLALVHP